MVKWRISGLNSWLTWQCPERRWAKDRLKVSEERILECHRAVKAENPFFQPSCPIIATNHTFFLANILANIRIVWWCHTFKCEKYAKKWGRGQIFCHGTLNAPSGHTETRPWGLFPQCWQIQQSFDDLPVPHGKVCPRCPGSGSYSPQPGGGGLNTEQERERETLPVRLTKWPPSDLNFIKF